MKVLIVGGAGFLGKRLASTIATQGGLHMGQVAQLTLVDLAFPEEMHKDGSFKCIEGDFSEASVMQSLIEEKPDIIFHLAAVVSGEAEKNFELGMRVNFQGSLQMLEMCRSRDYHPRIVFASSCGVFGGDVKQTISHTTGPKPRSSYGTQKAMVELLMNDYSRRGFVDARSIRLPTISVRPGKPNAATSSFLSGIVREPLNGQKATYPVQESAKFWLLSPKKVIQNFLHAANIDAGKLGDDRMITLPGITVSVEEMLQSLERIAGPKVAALASYEPDEFLQSIVLTWPPYFDTSVAESLGFVKDNSVDELILNYIQEEKIKLPNI
ncbi:D-erythronate dehydrogenase [Pleomorphovibrio marinus]|uniref:D-erythronate dehydrogenase n=1 Tax=Pleomorphovibrio marinus TaxID=2164132 RepID=UPI000E0C0D7E|nr:D-erythronate dehydrogenase [Pleomorphovibrio marinus]